MTRGEELIGFLHADVSGQLRGRSVPASELEKGLGRRPPPTSRRWCRVPRGPLGRRFAPPLLPLRRQEHGRESLGWVPSDVAQTRSLLARRGDGAAFDLLF